ncbi:hypothetical protein C8J57DRAFT_1525644 [Mycena rebaudengoi]|nr:hypothetical protein C8J57DRAFT_1525644 [Mycena rebaudengoi]
MLPTYLPTYRVPAVPARIPGNPGILGPHCVALLCPPPLSLLPPRPGTLIPHTTHCHWIFLAHSILVHCSVDAFHFCATTLRTFVSSKPSPGLDFAPPLLKTSRTCIAYLTVFSSSLYLKLVSMMLLVPLGLFLFSVIWQALTLIRTHRQYWTGPLYMSHVKTLS